MCSRKLGEEKKAESLGNIFIDEQFHLYALPRVTTYCILSFLICFYFARVKPNGSQNSLIDHLQNNFNHTY